MFESGQTLICSRGTRVKDIVLLLLDLVVTIIFSELETESTGVSSISTRYEFRKVERQRSMQDAGVEGMHNQRTNLEESGCLTRSRSSVEWSPLIVTAIVMEGPNRLVERWKSSGGPVDAKLTVGPLSSSSGMICGITNGVLVGDK